MKKMDKNKISVPPTKVRILGLSAFYHDSAAALIVDGKVVVAAEEERFSRVKHDHDFPLKAAQFCLRSQNIKINQIDLVAYYEKPLLKFERILETFVQTYPWSLRPFLKAIPDWMNQKIKVEHSIRKNLGFKGKIVFIPHHLSHAAAAFYPSPYTKSAILTLDGVGEYKTTGLWIGDGVSIAPLRELAFPHSLGLLYSTFTAFLGFRVNDDEYKVMGLAAYGNPRYVDQIRRVVKIKEDGSFNLDLEYFAFRESFKMWNGNFEKLFGKPRRLEEKITKRHQDLAASIQVITEEIYFKILSHLHQLTQLDTVCIGGGVALNALANGKIYQETPFKKVYIFGPSGDGGAAVGAALFAYHHILGKRNRDVVDRLSLGSSYLDREIKLALKESPLSYSRLPNRDLIEKVAYLLTRNNIIGWFQGQMELGPRALGNRSILANPKPAWMKDRVNEVKIREEFRPFAGSVLQEVVHKYFEVPEKNHWSPFMIFCFQVRKNMRSQIGAITHEDGSCRIQTISPKDGLYYQLIKSFGDLTGNYCLLNTSFNLKGEPIVETPKQALDDFRKTKLNYLVIGNYLIKKA